MSALNLRHTDRLRWREFNFSPLGQLYVSRLELTQSGASLSHGSGSFCLLVDSAQGTRRVQYVNWLQPKELMLWDQLKQTEISRLLVFLLLSRDDCFRSSVFAAQWVYLLPRTYPGSGSEAGEFVRRWHCYIYTPIAFAWDPNDPPPVAAFQSRIYSKLIWRADFDHRPTPADYGQRTPRFAHIVTANNTQSTKSPNSALESARQRS